jgi:hypothetical protein
MLVLEDYILRDNEICGMDADFDNIIDILRNTISAFNFNSFTSANILALLKSGMFW